VGWLSGRDITVGRVDAQSPGDGTTGAVRLRGDGDGVAYLQVTDTRGIEQWGYWRHDLTGIADWNGQGGLKSGGSLVLTEARMGAGRGIDADMVDGHHADYFPPAGAFTAGAVMAMVQTVDGAGSGLDADTLDGHHADYFPPAGAFTAGAVMGMVQSVDGTGSGLDADTLDGTKAIISCPPHPPICSRLSPPMPMGWARSCSWPCRADTPATRPCPVGRKPSGSSSW
jgi:hypothetical protein